MWLKNIISGFKTCVIYPKEVLDHDPTKEKSTQGDRVPMTDDPITDDREIHLHGIVETSIEATFTAEEETLFTRQHENGYKYLILSMSIGLN